MKAAIWCGRCPFGHPAAFLVLMLFVTASPVVLATAEDTSVSGNMGTMVAKILPLEAKVIQINAETMDFKGKTAGMEVKETATELRIELAGDVLFDFDKWDIRPAAESALDQVAKMLAQYPRAKITIDGYTDAKGSDSYNLRLSEHRAQSVKNWLTSHSAGAQHAIATKGLGSAKPVAPNANADGSDNPDGRQKNRRVEITVKKS